MYFATHFNKVNPQEMNSDNKNRGIIVFLLLLIITIGTLSYLNYVDYSSLKQAFQIEKQELESELDKVIADYDSALSGKITLTKQLREKRTRIIGLRDSLKELQEKNYSLMRKYRGRISMLEKQNKQLFLKIDSLNFENQTLQEENLAVKQELTSKNLLALQKQIAIDSLQQKVSIAEELEINNLIVVPMKRRRNGRYTSTSRRRRASAFKISYNVLKNDIAEKGKRKVYVQVVDADKNIISTDGHLTLKNGSKLPYSDAFTINYDNQKTNVVNLSEFNEGDLKKGKYFINLFLEGKQIGAKLVTLK